MKARTFPAHLVRRAQGDDGVALMTVLFVILVASALAMSLTGIVMSQTLPVMYEKKSTKTLHSAEAGIDYTLSRLRDSKGAEERTVTQPDGTSIIIDGDQTKLPCTAALGGPGTTTPNWQQSLDLGAAGRTDVTVTYYLTDPSGRDAAWRAANKMTCPTSLASVAPQFALITSTSRSTERAGQSTTQGNRALETVFSFRTTNVKIAGGRLQPQGADGDAGEQTYCMDAGADPMKGHDVTMKACDADVLGQQWVYDKQNRLSVPIRDDPTNVSRRLCLAVKLNQAGQKAELDDCSTSWQQQWNLDAYRQFRGTNTAATARTNRCLEGRLDQTVSLQDCLRAYTSWQTWNPDPAVGAASATARVNFVVNFERFGQCMDVLGGNVANEIIILYPCKIDPSKRPEWNQSFAPDPAQTLNAQDVEEDPWQGRYVTYNRGDTGDPYCLAYRSSPPTVGQRLLVSRCSTSDTRQRWSYTGKQAEYAQSYTIRPQDNSTQCIGYSGSPYYFDGLNLQALVLEPCDGSEGQKWNAPPKEQDAGLRNTREKRPS